MSSAIYINEHLLTIDLILLKNYQLDLKTDRSKFNTLMSEYKSLCKQHKNNLKILDIKNKFKELMAEAKLLQGIDKDCDILFEKVKLLTKRVYYKFVRGKCINTDDMACQAFTKLHIYRNNFDCDKLNKRGVRCNSFAYITQLIRNLLMYEIKTQNKQVSINNMINENLEFGFYNY